MEWVETTAKTLDAAREAALDQLGVAADEVEFDVVEEPRPGLFGRVRGEARIRARIRPAQLRPKQERRRPRRGDASTAATTQVAADGAVQSTPDADEASSPAAAAEPAEQPGQASTGTSNRTSTRTAAPKGRRRSPSDTKQEPTMNHDEHPQSTVTPDEVGAAAVTFMEGLTAAFGADGTVDVRVEGIELEVTVSGTELGLLVGPGGRTLNAVQDLARVAAQRRLGDHETRLRIDVAGYRERREAALTSFARSVAEQVRASGTARSLEPMTSADRKVVHDVLNDEEGVASRSVGDDPDRRIIVEPS